MISSTQQQKLIQLSQDQSNGLITADLNIVPSSFLGRLFWPIASHFVWIQKIFYGLNLEQSQKSLNTIRAKVLQLPVNDPMIAIFNKACLRYNYISPKKYQVKGIPSQAIAPNLDNDVLEARGPKLISILTYNILFPQKNGQHLSPFSTSIGYSKNEHNTVYENSSFRIPIIIKNLRKANKDINCLQEVTQDVFNRIAEELKKDGYVGCYRPHNKLHGVAIFYKENRFQKLQDFSGQFGTQKIDNQGKKLNKADGTPDMKWRRHLILDLKDLTTQKVTRVASCHFEDPRGLEIKSAHVSKVLQTMSSKPKNYKIDYEVIAGDFNQDQWGDKGVQRLTQPSLEKATALKPLFKNGYSFGGDLNSTEFTKADKKNYNSAVVPINRKIDHIFIKALEETKLIHLPLKNFDLRGSDHKAVAAGIIVGD